MTGGVSDTGSVCIFFFSFFATKLTLQQKVLIFIPPCQNRSPKVYWDAFIVFLTVKYSWNVCEVSPCSVNYSKPADLNSISILNNESLDKAVSQKYPRTTENKKRIIKIGRELENWQRVQRHFNLIQMVTYEACRTKVHINNGSFKKPSSQKK